MQEVNNGFYVARQEVKVARQRKNNTQWELLLKVESWSSRIALSKEGRTYGNWAHLGRGKVWRASPRTGCRDMCVRPSAPCCLLWPQELSGFLGDWMSGVPLRLGTKYCDAAVFWYWPLSSSLASNQQSFWLQGTRQDWTINTHPVTHLE